MRHDTPSTPLSQPDTRALIVLSFQILIIQGLLHLVSRLLPDLPPDPPGPRLLSAGVALAIIVAVVVMPGAGRYSRWLQIPNAVVALGVVHLLVLLSGNEPLYLAASLAAVYSVPLAFVRLSAWLWTLGLVAAIYIGGILLRGAFSSATDTAAPLLYAASYVLATALVFGRDRLLARRTPPPGLVQATHDEHGVSDELTSDLVLAREIQTSLLPDPAPPWPAIELVCYSQPARDIGGDFYSYYAWSEQHVAVAVGDVSGKGVSAALLMAASLAQVNASYGRRAQPQRRIARLDRQVMAYTKPREQNCALCYVELDGPLLTVVNAGAIAPYIRRANGTVEATDAWGFALGHGLGAERGYQPVQRSLGRGDLVVIVSDGLLEARNARGVLFSFGRLEQAIAGGPSTSAAAMRTHLLKRLAKFTGRVEPHDDVTIVVLRVR